MNIINFFKSLTEDLFEDKITGLNEGERQAALYLKKSGYNIVFQNYRQKWGEIDIIASKGNFIIFVEVKQRKSVLFGTPGQAVNKKKQRRIKAVAQFYLIKNKIKANVRFDVIEVMGEDLDGKFILESINHIENAF